MKLLKENAILKSLNESEADATGFTLKEVTEKLYGGSIDIDVSDVDIDMYVAFCYDTDRQPEDEYDRFIEILAERTKVVKAVRGPYGDSLVCDFSSVFKPYNEELMNVFDMNNSEFDDSEAYYEAVLNLEGLIPGMAGESTYKELNDILEGKGKKLEPVNQFNHKAMEESEDVIPVVNPGDEAYTNRMYKVSLYYGSGYSTEQFKAYANNEEEALNHVVAYCEKESMSGLIYTMSEIEDLVKKDYKKEFADFFANKCDSECDWFDFATEYLNYIYIDATTEGASQPYFVHGENSNIEEINSMNESADSKITTADLNKGVTLSCDIGGKEHTIYARWSDNFDFDEEVASGTIPEGANPEDWGGIYFEINIPGEEFTDGGFLVTDKDEFTPSELGSSLLSLTGDVGENFKIVAGEPEAPAEEKKEEPTGKIITIEDLDNGGNNFIFRGDAGNGDERLLINFALSSEGGIDYTIYREGGAEVDGGVMDVDADKTWDSLKAVAEELASFQGIKNTNSFIACDEGSADEALPQYGFIKESVKGKKNLGTVIKEAAKINNKAKGLIKEAEEERSWLKDKNKYEGFKKFVDKQLRDGAIDDPEYVNSLSDKEYEDLLTLTWMKDKDMLDMYEERLDEEVTESEPESATKTNKPNKVRNYLNYELEDDDTETGGVAFNGETVEDFIKDADIKEDDDLDKLNKALVSCGIRPIAEGYESSYRGDDYWDLSDAYVNGELTDRELAWELIKMYDNYSAVEKTFYEITGKKEVPEMGPDESEVKEITPDEANQYIMEWENNRESVKRGRFITQDGDKFIGIDNRTGDCWVEEFNNKGSVIDWLEDRIEADGTIIESVSEINAALEKVKNDIHYSLISYSLNNDTNELTLTYEIPMSVGSTDRVVQLSGDTVQDLVSSIRRSASELADDFYGSLTDEDDFYGYSSKEELDDRISDEEAILNNIASAIEDNTTNLKESSFTFVNAETTKTFSKDEVLDCLNDIRETVSNDTGNNYYEIIDAVINFIKGSDSVESKGMKEAISDPVDLMCGFIGDLFNNMSEGFKANSESLYDWCEGGDAFRNAGFDEDTCKKLDNMLNEINPLVQNINQTLYAIAGELDESADDGSYQVNFSINGGKYVISVLEKAVGGEVDLLVKAKDGKGSSAILPGYDQVEGFELTKDDEPFYSESTISEEDVVDLVHKFKPDLKVGKVERI